MQNRLQTSSALTVWSNMIGRFGIRNCRTPSMAVIFVMMLAFVSGCNANEGQTQSNSPAQTSSATQSESTRAGQQRPKEATSTSDEDKTVLAVSRAIRKNKLVDKPDQCLAYQFDAESSKDYFVVEVRENHRHTECGGDPQTSPRLFTVRVSRTNGEMSTDANSPSGEFHPLPQ
jgi:hypothetical protein